jgi:hypothetical protein
MRTNLLRMTLGLVALTFGSIALSRADEDDEEARQREAVKAARTAVLLIVAGKAEDPTKPPGDVPLLAKKHGVDATMKVFGKSRRGGIGIGAGFAAARGRGWDSIEMLVRDYAISAPARAEVVTFNNDLLQLGRITLAVSSMMPHYVPTKDGGKGKTADQWLKQSEQMRQGTLDFMAAVRAKDHVAVGAAAKRLNEACAMCHKIFRDDR